MKQIDQFQTKLMTCGLNITAVLPLSAADPQFRRADDDVRCLQRMWIPMEGQSI